MILTIPDLSGCAELEHLSFSPDGKKLVAYTGKTDGDAPCGDGRAFLWRLPDPTPLYLTLSTERYNAVFAAAWSADGKQVAIGGDSGKDFSGTVGIWDTSTGTLLKSLQGQPSTVRTLLWSHDQQILISSSGFFDPPRTIVGWDTATGIVRFEDPGFWRSATDLFWLKDGSSFAAMSINQLRIFDTHGQILKGGLDSPYGIYGVTELVWSPDGKRLSAGIAVESNFNKIVTWDVPTRTPLYALETPGRLVESSLDGKMLVTGSHDPGQYVPYQYWDLLTGQNIASSDSTYVPGQGWTGGSTHSPNGKMLVEIGPSDSANHFSRRIASIKDTQTKQIITQLGGFIGDVQSAAWSPDGKYVAVSGGMSISLGSRFVDGWDENALRVWDTETWEPVQKFLGHTGSVNSLSWSPDSRFLASGSADGTVIIWDVAP